MRLATHFGVNGSDIDEVIKYCQAFDVKYLSLGYLSEDLVPFKAKLASSGITLAMVEIGWLNNDLLFGNLAKKSELQGFFDRIRVIGNAGIEMGHLFADVRSSGAENADDEWETLIHFYQSLAEHSEKCGTKVATHAGWTPEHLIKDCVTWKKLLDAVPSKNIGVNMCLGCLQIMSPADIQSEIDETLKVFGDRLFIVHTRDIKVEEGNKWLDVAMGQGEIDLAVFIDALYRSGLDPLLLPEHMPRVVGEKNSEISAAYALGYMSGMIKQREWIG